MRSYETARTLFSFLAFWAWCVVIAGVLVALVSAAGASQYGGAGAGLLATAPGIGIGIAGLILVAFVQMGRATVDTAEYTQQMLKIARDQLEVSQQGLNGAFLFALLEFWDQYSSSNTLNFHAILLEPGSPGRVFLMDENDLAVRLMRLDLLTDGKLTWTETAGMRQVVRTNLVAEVEKWQILEKDFDRKIPEAA